MKMYRTGWLVAGIALLVVGVGAAAHGSPRAPLIALVVVAVACSLVSSIVVDIRGTSRPRRARARSVATSALVGGGIAVALVGFTALLGQRVGLLAFVVLATSPRAVAAYGRWLRSVPTPSAAQLDAIARAFANTGVGYVGVQPEPDPRELTDEELSQRWRASCLYLRGRPSTAQVIRSMEQRQVYLDEFERRYPGAFAAWLTSGAGTLDCLTPYAVRSRDDHARIDWDELTRGRD
jgi:hypothetical protein